MFEALFQWVNDIVQMYDMAHSICLIKLYQIKMRKKFDFLFLTTLKVNFKGNSTLFSMGYFKDATVWGHYGPHCNFGVSYSRRIKFGNMGYFDVLSSKMALNFKFRASMASLLRHNR